MINIEDIKTHFKKRFYFIVGLLTVGCMVFSIWFLLFFFTSLWQWLNVLHFIGFFYLIFATSIGFLTYSLVLGTVIYKFKLFKIDIGFRSAFYKLTCLTVLSFVLALGMAKFVLVSVNRMEIHVRNVSNKNIEEVTISYPPGKKSSIHKLKINQNERVLISPGEGSLFVTITFSNGTKAEKLIEGYVDQTINRTPLYQIDIEDNDIKILKIKK